MVATIARWLPWCLPPGTAKYNNAPTCCATSLVVKTREYYCFYNVFIRHDASSTCLSVCGLHGSESIILSAGGAVTIILSAGGVESMMISACAESMIVSVPPAASMILSLPFDHVITLLSCSCHHCCHQYCCRAVLEIHK